MISEIVMRWIIVCLTVAVLFCTIMAFFFETPKDTVEWVKWKWRHRGKRPTGSKKNPEP